MFETKVIELDLSDGIGASVIEAVNDYWNQWALPASYSVLSRNHSHMIKQHYGRSTEVRAYFKALDQAGAIKLLQTPNGSYCFLPIESWQDQMRTDGCMDILIRFDKSPLNKQTRAPRNNTVQKDF